VPSVGSVGVRSYTSSFNNITLGLYRTSLAPRNPARIFSGINVFSKAALKAVRKVSLLI
jgi:hypothetical protein